MLRLRVIHAVAPRVRYFLRSPALADHERAGQWLGSACLQAGLTSTARVTERAFGDALRGYTPAGVYMGRQRKSNRRAGWDAVMSAAKSISVAALCGAADIKRQVMAAWHAAITDFLPALESLAARCDGPRPLVPTGNLIAAAFTHERSRRNDPHLHTHFVVVNATYDHSISSWRGLEASPLFRHSALLDATFQRELHRHLVQRGMPASLDANGRAQLPVPEPICRRLSQASRVLDAAESADRPRDLVPIRNRDMLRNLLNDRLRPPKSTPTAPLKDTLNPSERIAISRACVRRRPPPSAPTPPPPKIAERIEAAYHHQTLIGTNKRLFGALLTAAREFLTVPFATLLAALPLVREPAPLGRATRAHAALLRANATRTRWTATRARRSSAQRSASGPSAPLPTRAPAADARAQAKLHARP